MLESNFLTSIIQIIMLIISLTIFAFIVNSFMKPILQNQEMNAPYDESDMLEKFFCVLKRFNEDREISLSFIRQTENYFRYSWEFG